MSTVNIPGFTAEVSLYKTINYYHMVGAIHQDDGTVHPAQTGSGDPFAYQDAFVRVLKAAVRGFSAVKSAAVSVIRQSLVVAA